MVNEHQDQELVHRERSHIGPILAVGLILFPIIYVLSPPFLFPLFSGPGDETFQLIYWPIIQLAESYQPIMDFYNWYGELFPWIP